MKSVKNSKINIKQKRLTTLKRTHKIKKKQKINGIFRHFSKLKDVVWIAPSNVN